MKMSLPKLSWLYSRKTEAERIGFTVNMLLDQARRYTHHGILVLPYLLKNTVYLPQIPPYIFKRLAKHQHPELNVFFFKASKELSELDKYVAELQPEQYAKKQKQFEKIYPKFMSIMAQISPGLFQGVKEIVIRPTQYGTTSSEISAAGVDPSRIELYWRIDGSISSIAQMLISERFFRSKKMSRMEWKTQMQIRDYLMTETPVGELFPDYDENNITDVDLSTLPAKVLKDSSEYLESLGLKYNKSFWHDGMGINFRGKHIRLTKSEKALMVVLIENPNKLVNYDAISLKVWGHKNISKFSLNAIAKMVQRIRTKFKKEGINPKVIEVYSGEGYRLITV